MARDALAALARISVEERKPKQIEPKITSTASPKLADEIAAIGQNDWPALLNALGKVRSEVQSTGKSISSQASSALSELHRQMKLQREETQMLWWLFGGYSRSLERSFSTFCPAQAALVGAVDLGELTSVSHLGPFAAGAMLERIIGMSDRSGAQAPLTLASAVDGLTREDLDRLNVRPNTIPELLVPATTAIVLARTIGTGLWYARFQEVTRFDPMTTFEPTNLAQQLYREHLLGQLQ